MTSSGVSGMTNQQHDELGRQRSAHGTPASSPSPVQVGENGVRSGSPFTERRDEARGMFGAPAAAPNAFVNADVIMADVNGALAKLNQQFDVGNTRKIQVEIPREATAEHREVAKGLAAHLGIFFGPVENIAPQIIGNVDSVGIAITKVKQHMKATKELYAVVELLTASLSQAHSDLTAQHEKLVKQGEAKRKQEDAHDETANLADALRIACSQQLPDKDLIQSLRSILEKDGSPSSSNVSGEKNKRVRVKSPPNAVDVEVDGQTTSSDDGDDAIDDDSQDVYKKRDQIAAEANDKDADFIDPKESKRENKRAKKLKRQQDALANAKSGSPPAKSTPREVKKENTRKR
jgi:hypothetical protein